MSDKIRHADHQRLFERAEKFLESLAVDTRYVFACEDLVCIWHPAKHAAPALMMDRERENEIIVLYLKQQGRAFKSMEEATIFYENLETTRSRGSDP